MRTRIKRFVVMSALALSLVTGGAMATAPITAQPAAAAPYGYYDVYINGQWHWIPTYCYSSDWVVRYFYGYYNSRTCVMNHAGYPGIYR